MEKTFTVNDSFSEGLTAYIQREVSKGKSPVRAMTRIMRDWLFRAMDSTRIARRNEVFDTYSQLSRMRLRPTTKRAKIKAIGEMQETLALVIVRRINWKGAKNASYREAARLAKQFRGRRVASVGYQKAGFVPALRVLRAIHAEGKTPPAPKFTAKVGTFHHQITGDEIRMVATNLANAIAEREPRAFEGTIGAVIAKFEGYLIADMLAEQRKAGLDAKSV